LLRAGDPDVATASARKLLAEFGLRETDVERLQNVPADKLLAAAHRAGLAADVVVDGDSVPHQTWDLRAPEESAAIPLMVGNDKDESTLFSLKDEALFSLDAAALRARLITAGIAANDLDRLLALYHRDHPADSPTDLYFRISSDRGARHNATRQAELKMEQGRAPAYVYYCQWNTPLADGTKKIKAFHTSDLPLTMRLVRFPESEQLSRQLSGAWAAFARTGSPSQKGLRWPAYTLAERTTMVFDGSKSEAVDDPDRDERIMLRDRPSGKPL
jgi:para-nitrobenzyl esterase